MPDDRFINQMSEQDPVKHVAKNKNIVAGYQLSNIMKSEPYVDGCIELLKGHIDRMAQDGAAPVELSRWLNYFAFDVAGEVTFSRRFGFLDTGLDMGGAYANGRMVLIYIALIGRAYWMHKLLLGNPLLDTFGLRPMNHLEATAKSAIEARQKNPEVRKDMMEQWLEMRRNHPERMEEKEIFCAAVLNIAAGSDTVSATIQAFFYYLLKNPKYYNRLQEELDSAQARGELSPRVTYLESQKLPYLQACVSHLSSSPISILPSLVANRDQTYFIYKGQRGIPLSSRRRLSLPAHCSKGRHNHRRTFLPGRGELIQHYPPLTVLFRLDLTLSTDDRWNSPLGSSTGSIYLWCRCRIIQPRALALQRRPSQVYEQISDQRTYTHTVHHQPPLFLSLLSLPQEPILLTLNAHHTVRSRLQRLSRPSSSPPGNLQAMRYPRQRL